MFLILLNIVIRKLFNYFKEKWKDSELQDSYLSMTKQTILEPPKVEDKHSQNTDKSKFDFLINGGSCAIKEKK